MNWLKALEHFGISSHDAQIVDDLSALNLNARDTMIKLEELMGIINHSPILSLQDIKERRLKATTPLRNYHHTNPKFTFYIDDHRDLVLKICKWADKLKEGKTDEQ